jgi:hypothetical protein
MSRFNRAFVLLSCCLASAVILLHCAAASAQPRREKTTTADVKPAAKGLVPLNEMSASDRYKDQDGGLYGGGQNIPPAALRQTAEAELKKIQPLDADGKPAADGRIVFISLSMSNATQEFSTFKQVADRDPRKSPKLTIVDCAQGGQTMARWADPDAAPWSEAMRRLEAAKVTPQQVQVAWVKPANAGPRGELKEHGVQLYRDTLTTLQNMKKTFPNLRIVYLSSRIFGGYASSQLNPEPYAYEGAFACRWLIQDQMDGEPRLNYDPAKGAVHAPLLLWGPYLWANGETPRKEGTLNWSPDDFVNDLTHPSQSGRAKVAGALLEFVATDALAKSWFAER